MFVAIRCAELHDDYTPASTSTAISSRATRRTFAQKFGTNSGRVTLRDHGDGQGMMMLGDKPFRPVHSGVWDTSARLAEMDASHVETQIVCATPVMFAYDAPAAQAAYVGKRLQRPRARILRTVGGRIRALAQVPLQDAELACAELSRGRCERAASACRLATTSDRARWTTRASCVSSRIVRTKARRCWCTLGHDGRRAS